jgi:hypothetical protein
LNCEFYKAFERIILLFEWHSNFACGQECIEPSWSKCCFEIARPACFGLDDTADVQVGVYFGTRSISLLGKRQIQSGSDGPDTGTSQKIVA